MTTTRVINRFSLFNPIVKWVNASHCILNFATAYEGQQFLMQQVKNFDGDAIFPWELNRNVLARNWLELNSYMEMCFVRTLYIRNLTKRDEDEIAKFPTAINYFDTFKAAKMELESVLLSNQGIRETMTKIDEEENASKLADPAYRSNLRKKRLEQKKIESLAQEYCRGNYRD